MMKHCYLFTATVSKYVQDVIFKLFGIKVDNFKNYRVVLSNFSAGTGLFTYKVEVKKDAAEHW